MLLTDLSIEVFAGGLLFLCNFMSWNKVIQRFGCHTVVTPSYIF